MIAKQIISFGPSIACAALIGFGGYLIYGCYVASHETIQRIDSYAQAADTLAAADSNTLVLFDVDDTLIEPASVLFRPPIVEKAENLQFLRDLNSRIFAQARMPENYYWSIWRVADVPVVIEPAIIDTIRSLQERGVKVMALTALNSGSNFIIPSLPEWRFNKLKEVGIDFSKVDFPNIEFKEFVDAKGKYPVLFNGILCTARLPKGQVLSIFLDHIQWKPSKVIFFDDDYRRVESVEQAMKERSIPFQGFAYLGAEHLPGELDRELAEFQLHYLVEHEKWLSDDQATKITKRSKVA